MKVCITGSAHITNAEMASPAWIAALEKERLATGADIIISHDSWKQPDLGLPKEWKVFDYEAQKKELGEELFEEFTQFHKNCSIKNFGLWYAYKQGYDVVILIDSDCVVLEGFVAEHIKHMSHNGDGWENPLKTLSGGFYSRGFPYNKRKIQKWAHMGLWTNATDLYGKDRIGVELPQALKDLVGLPDYTETSAFFPLSGMNVAFAREALPYVLFQPVFYFEGQKFNRHDDIWCGYILQKVGMLKNKSFSYGNPSVFHDSTVDPHNDAREEEAMIKYENNYYALIEEAMKNLSDKSSHDEIFSALIEGFSKSEIFAPLAKAFSYHKKVYSRVS